MNFPHPGLLCAKFGLWFWIKGFLKLIHEILLNQYLSLEWGLHLKTSWISFTQGCFVSSLIEIVTLLLTKRFRCRLWNFCYFINFLMENMCNHLNTLYSSLLREERWNWPIENVKRSQWRTDERTTEHLSDQKSSLHLSARLR